MTNRIETAIESMRERLIGIRADKLEELERGMAIDFSEHYAYQNAQAKAHVMGRINSDEASVIYRALGEGYTDGNGGWNSDTDLATKCAVTAAIAELIRA